MPDKIGQYRWTICSLLFFATTINYLDRQVISLVVVDYLTPEFHWSENDYANVTIAFQLSYAVALFGFGRFIDKLGSKIGYALALVLWSLASIGHAFVRTTLGFFIARSALGITESGNFPAAVKATAEWFPKKERALATGIFNSGTNIGAIIAPLTVPFIAKEYGWRVAFIITGSFGLLWLIFWFWLYEIPQKSKRVGKSELAYIHSDDNEMNNNVVENKIGWGKLLKHTQTWGIISGKFLTDGVWWFYLFWLPKFLDAQFHLNKEAIVFPIALVYIISSAGSIAGGWLPLRLIQNGYTIFNARKNSMLLYACCALPVLLIQFIGPYSLWIVMIIIGIATAGHQAWSANVYTLASDLFPKRAVASVIGIAGMTGALGSILLAKGAGLLFDKYKTIGNINTGYYIVFYVCAFAYVVAWLLIQAFVPKMRPVDL